MLTNFPDGVKTIRKPPAMQPMFKGPPMQLVSSKPKVRFSLPPPGAAAAEFQCRIAQLENRARPPCSSKMWNTSRKRSGGTGCGEMWPQAVNPLDTRRHCSREAVLFGQIDFKLSRNVPKKRNRQLRIESRHTSKRP